MVGYVRTQTNTFHYSTFAYKRVATRDGYTHSVLCHGYLCYPEIIQIRKSGTSLLDIL